MTAVRITTVRVALREAAERRLEEGWLYLPCSEIPALDSPCVIVSGSDESEEVAAKAGFPQEGLYTRDIEDTAKGAVQFEDPPSDDLLLEAFLYYWRFDAWLPHPGASDPPTTDEWKRNLDREFFDLLGAERADVPCHKQGCPRGAVAHSSLCRIHHFEMVKKEPCPFGEAGGR
ncbi:DUF7716 domain-containing protein [Usitatibacter palustris]|uniref:DUF7716 domain-containing protein n=1 Tax=Usitatibacter palustris TaxID=2732487 RepID=A0A6M4H2H2_9PROT|nr:hypothetical protein [Usitatibacter palustris]QJR13532.1 hypothetical protein DSM104440_00316 [Usitatibacter palustris]